MQVHVHMQCLQASQCYTLMNIIYSTLRCGIIDMLLLYVARFIVLNIKL